MEVNQMGFGDEPDMEHKVKEEIKGDSIFLLGIIRLVGVTKFLIKYSLCGHVIFVGSDSLQIYYSNKNKDP